MSEFFTIKARCRNGLSVRTIVSHGREVHIDPTVDGGYIVTFGDDTGSYIYVVGNAPDVEGSLRAREIFIENAMGQTTERLLSNIETVKADGGGEPDQAGRFEPYEVAA